MVKRIAILIAMPLMVLARPFHDAGKRGKATDAFAKERANFPAHPSQHNQNLNL
ncbi:hypothetical protein SAMN02745171_01508 [Porphyromonas circumdentaria]|uniref:Uncharacterized protein n=2 Tax=Porphyromonas circumdentaria TaxID=29524 RepID=A0A1T4PLV8_9PORP|nr:hypothetical protein [Porphyromonas circumdentaria]SJZ92246.1 hypothetical protein SAMN02745171_01508 [Porphyromonas circumdentaria]